VAVLCLLARTTGAQDIGTLIVVVQSKGEAVPGADVVAGSARGLTGRDVTLTLSVPLGPIDVVVTRFGYDPASAPVDVRSGDDIRVTIELNARSEFEETIIVAATRSERRIEDTPLRIEVVPAEEVQEKIAMTPGDVSMLLAETNGLRVQSTAPSVGGASVRIQGLRGRYTHVLADGRGSSTPSNRHEHRARKSS
jgi:iron complex outermembrane receptor protein